MPKVLLALALLLFQSAAHAKQFEEPLRLAFLEELCRQIHGPSGKCSWSDFVSEISEADVYAFRGRRYAEGRGVPKDDQQAVYWFRKAAELGHDSGQYELAVMYAEGRGVPKDDQQAYFWLLLSAAQGHGGAALYRDLVEERLTPSQRAAAQAQARTWKPAATTAELATKPEGEAQAVGRPATSGSAIRIASGVFVTNHHVVRGCRRLTVNQALARVRARDEANDLALLAAPGDKGPTVPMRATPARLGEEAIVAGFPLEGALSGLAVTTGTVSRLSGVRGDSREMQISAPVQQGNSGGPVLDGSGNLIGVVSGKLDALRLARATGDIPQNVNFAIKLSVLREFLDTEGVVYTQAHSGPKLPAAEVASRAQRFTALVQCWR